MSLGTESSESLAESAATSLTLGTIYGLIGHPYLRWAMRIQKRVDAHRQDNLSLNQFTQKYFVEVAPIAAVAIIAILVMTIAALTTPDWLPELIEEAT